MKAKKRFWSQFKCLTLFGFLIIGIVFSGIAILNMNLPKESLAADHLSVSEQHRIEEIFNLKTVLGDLIWPGWGALKSPVVLYNESHIFFVGTDDNQPSPGWTRIPYRSNFGSSWNLMRDDISYFRQTLPGNGESPQAFIVQVGDQFGASMPTKEWTKIKLVKMIKKDLPGFLKPIFPYRLFTNKIDSDKHIVSVLHKSFHVFQAHQNYDRFENAEKINSLRDLYPWQEAEFRKLWVDERQLLARALKEPNDDQAKSMVMEWLSMREVRRSTLSEKLISYEQEREWLEGLAKYAEINSWKMASDTNLYTPLAFMMDDPDFNFYQNAESNFNKELLQLQSDLGFSESVFYYSGWAQAELLDRFYSDWKAQVMKSGVYLEDLLRGECIPLSCGGLTLSE